MKYRTFYSFFILFPCLAVGSIQWPSSTSHSISGFGQHVVNYGAISTSLLVLFSTFPSIQSIEEKIEKKNDEDGVSKKAFNVIFRRDVGIEALHKFVKEIKKRSSSKEHPDFHLTVDKVLTNMKLIRVVNPSPAAWKFITSHKFVKEYYETQTDNNEL